MSQEAQLSESNFAWKRCENELGLVREAAASESASLQRQCEAEKERRLDIAKRSVRQLMQSQMAGAFNSFVEVTREVKEMRARSKRVVQRLMQSQMAGAFVQLRDATQHMREQRAVVVRAMERWHKTGAGEAFDAWVDYIDSERQQQAAEGQALATADAEKRAELSRTREESRARDYEARIAGLEQQSSALEADLVQVCA